MRLGDFCLGLDFRLAQPASREPLPKMGTIEHLTSRTLSAIIREQRREFNG